jgi:branched-chain amino acid transport system ATP-binding protein
LGLIAQWFGKDTIINVVTGVYPCDGDPLFLKEGYYNFPAHSIACIGIVRTFQGAKVFLNLNVVQNVMTGVHCRTRSTFIDAILGTPREQKETKESEERAMKLLEMMGLIHWKEARACDLPQGVKA